MKNLQLLNESILDKYGPKKIRMVAIVGNAGVNEDDQDIIATADCVVRFNNYATREKINHTTDPNRCDILFSTFDLHSKDAKPKDVVIGIPFPFKAKEIYGKPSRWYRQSNIWMVNPYENMAMCQELHIDSLGHRHPLPSIGFTALWHMHSWSAQFYICGFNWYFNGLNRFQNWDLKNTDYPTNWNHNYPKEIRWILTNLAKRNNIMFSSSCQKILKTAEYLISY